MIGLSLPQACPGTCTGLVQTLGLVLGTGTYPCRVVRLELTHLTCHPQDRSAQNIPIMVAKPWLGASP